MLKRNDRKKVTVTTVQTRDSNLKRFRTLAATTAARNTAKLKRFETKYQPETNAADTIRGMYSSLHFTHF
jgi:hypothetical protein